MQVAVTAVVVVVLAVVLTVWRHNGSTYLTGFWDNGSQTLVFGRMLQMQQNQTSPGGFMGVYTQDWSDEQNRYWYRDNTPVSPQDFQAYTHQTGLQGWAFGVLNKVLSVFEDRGEARETMLYNINSMLFYAATLLVCLAVWQAWGPLSALAWLCAVVFAPWPQRGMKDLYWCLWTWLLPALAGLLLCAVTRRRGKTPWWCYLLVFAACMVRCMCGFEFISTFLILCEAPLVYCWAGGDRRAWLRRMICTGFAAVGGVAAALGAWFIQGVIYFGSAAGSWQNLTGAVTSRVSLTDDMVSDVSVAQVLARYFVEVLRSEKVLHQCGTFICKDSFYNDRFRMQRLSRISLIPTLIIFRTKNQFAGLRPSNGPGTHHTGFYCNIQRTLVQVLSAKYVGGSSDSLHFGMGRHIIQCLCQVMGTGYDPFFADNHCPYRDFAPLCSLAGFYQCLFHEVSIVQRHHQRLMSCSPKRVG